MSVGRTAGEPGRAGPSAPGGVHLPARMRVPFGGRSLSWGYAPVSGSRCPGVSYSHVATRGDVPRGGPASADCLDLGAGPARGGGSAARCPGEGLTSVSITNTVGSKWQSAAGAPRLWPAAAHTHPLCVPWWNPGGRRPQPSAPALRGRGAHLSPWKDCFLPDDKALSSWSHGQGIDSLSFFFFKVLIGKAKSWQCQGSPYVALETPLSWVWRLPAGCVLPWPAHLCNEQRVLPPLRGHTRSPQQAEALPTPIGAQGWEGTGSGDQVPLGHTLPGVVRLLLSVPLLPGAKQSSTEELPLPLAHTPAPPWTSARSEGGLQTLPSAPGAWPAGGGGGLAGHVKRVSLGQKEASQGW